MGPREDREREKRSDAMTAARAHLWQVPTGKPVDPPPGEPEEGDTTGGPSPGA